MTVQLNQSSYGGVPHMAAVKIDDDGQVTGSQTSGYRVGHFARSLTTRERTALTRAMDSARQAEPPAPADPDAPIRPSGTEEELIADGLPYLCFDAHDVPEGFEKLVRVLLKLRGNLPDSPVAAVELQVDGSPLAARLRHVGTAPVAVRLGTLELQATLFGPDSATVDSTSRTVDGSDVDGPVDQGWTFPLADDLGIARPGKGGFLTVSVRTPEVDILGNGVLGPTELSWMIE